MIIMSMMMMIIIIIIIMIIMVTSLALYLIDKDERFTKSVKTTNIHISLKKQTNKQTKTYKLNNSVVVVTVGGGSGSSSSCSSSNCSSCIFFFDGGRGAWGEEDLFVS